MKYSFHLPGHEVSEREKHTELNYRDTEIPKSFFFITTFEDNIMNVLRARRSRRLTYEVTDIRYLRGNITSLLTLWLSHLWHGALPIILLKLLWLTAISILTAHSLSIFFLLHKLWSIKTATYLDVSSLSLLFDDDGLSSWWGLAGGDKACINLPLLSFHIWDWNTRFSNTLILCFYLFLPNKMYNNEKLPLFIETTQNT